MSEIVSLERARALREAAASDTVCRFGEDLFETQGERDLRCAAPDLATSVIALHEEVAQLRATIAALSSGTEARGDGVTSDGGAA